MQSLKKPIQVMVVDDSVFARAHLREVIEGDAEKRFQVAASAKDGKDAIYKALFFEIDVILMDVHMPGMSGIAATEAILKQKKVPVIMFSSLTSAGAAVTLEALNAGAVDFILKPDTYEQYKEIQSILFEKLEQATVYNLTDVQQTGKKGLLQASSFSKKDSKQVTNIIGLGSSTGGPAALQKIISQLPATFPGCLVIVQHMPETGGFVESMAHSLQRITAMKVKVAQDGMEIENGVVLIAPEGKHLEVFKRGDGYYAVTHKRGKTAGYRPSVDILFSSLARLSKEISVYGVILTGMGSDGVNGCHALKREGMTVITESKRTAVVYGMPKQVVERGLSDYQEDLLDIFPKITQLLKKNNAHE